ncbi:MAG: TonB-dependent receptor [Polaribacter sp.]|uniref:TonB-dependent receptor n=1 Tax=Polaribacter sp. TaxID=1920175 RepID=UPI0032667BFE
MKIKYCFFALLMFFNTAFSQDCNYTFSGKVEDFHEKLVLTDATVYIKSINKFSLTDSNGNFKIENLCKGKIIVEISHLSCEKKVVEINITGNTYKVFELEHHNEGLDEIKINTTLDKNKTIQSNNLKESIIDNFSAASLGDAIKEIPGISSINTGSNVVKPIVNGLHSSRVLVYTNDVQLQDHDWGIEHAPSIDINTADRITVVKGANALEYSGNAIGGIILIEPNRIISKDTLFGKTILNYLTNAKAYSVATNLNKYYQKGWYAKGDFSYKKFGDSKTPDYNLSNTGFNTSSFAFKAGLKKFEYGFDVYYSYLKNEIGILSAAHIGNISDLVNAINSNVPLIINDFSYNIDNPKQEVKHQLFKLSSYKRFKRLGKLKLQYSYQNNHRQEFDTRRGDRDLIPATDLTLKTHSLKLDFKFDANSDATYKIGVSALYQNNFPDPDTGIRRIIPDYDKYELGVFGIANYKFNNFVLNTAIRYDYSRYNAQKYYLKTSWNSEGYNNDFSNWITQELDSKYLVNPIFNYHNIALSTGINYTINDNSNLLINYGLSNRPPNPSELFSDGLHHSAARIETGSLYLKTENSNRLGISYSYNNSKLLLNLEGYFNAINNFIYIEPTGIEQTIRGAFPVYNYQQTSTNLFGLDATIKYNITNQWSLKNTSSYIYGQDVSNSLPLIDMPPLQIRNKLEYINKDWHQFYTSLESVFVGKQNRYPDNNFETYIPETDSYTLVDISSTPKAYHLLNFNTGLNFNIGKNKLNLQFSIDNLLNTSYRNYLNRLRYFADDLGRNFKIQLKINY